MAGEGVTKSNCDRAPTRWDSSDAMKMVRWAWPTIVNACHSLMCNAPGPTSPVSPLADLPLWRTDCDFALLNTPCLALAGADRSASRRTAERVQVCDFSSHNVVALCAKSPRLRV